jgi:glycosyltransferase involved in cell wall biosynthesis
MQPGLWERISFKNHITPQQLAEELAEAAIFVHAARADNSPNSVKEAVVAGVPVVATRTGGIPDYVSPGMNGLLFESGNTDDCREKLRAALRGDIFPAGAVDAAELARVRQYLSSTTMARKFMDAYRLVADLPGLGRIS